MRIDRVSIQGFRAFKNRTDIVVGPFTTIVGKNDTGKSSILHALDIFFNNSSPDDGDFNQDQNTDDPVIIQVSFSELPASLQLEVGVDTDLSMENLLDLQRNFTVRKTYIRKNPKKPKVMYVVEDFVDSNYQNLCSLKEAQLNEKGRFLGLDFKKSGAGITNKSKRETIRKIGVERNISKGTIEIELAESALKVLDYLSVFSLFRADESLSEEGTAFQKEFKAVVETAIGKISGKANIEKGVEDEIDQEVKKIHSFLLKHTDEVASIKARPSFKWKDLVSFYLECRDKQGKEIAFAKRGSGLRRLLMVAYFQYLAQRNKEKDSLKSNIYAIEEPETYLHPGAQRDLLDSFKTIATSEQVMISSHSPVFAGSTDIGNLVLITRENGVAQVLQGNNLKLETVSEELGVEPSDQIYGYKAIVFAEGPTDCDFINQIVEKFFNGGKLSSTFESKQIGILPGGGNNLKHWVTRKAIKGINRRYAVILDSDRKTSSEQISKEKQELKSKIERDGGICFILTKREIENYLHPDLIKEKTGKDIPDSDFDDIKKSCGDKISGLVQHMTVSQILERDVYSDNGSQKHELLEICTKILEMV
ncbi:MAG: AAA family ATPase [Candidatus Omnitrophota bacterium]